MEYGGREGERSALCGICLIYSKQAPRTNQSNVSYHARLGFTIPYIYVPRGDYFIRRTDKDSSHIFLCVNYRIDECLLILVDYHQIWWPWERTCWQIDDEGSRFLTYIELMMICLFLPSFLHRIVSDSDKLCLSVFIMKLTTKVTAFSSPSRMMISISLIWWTDEQPIKADALLLFVRLVPMIDR